MKFRLITVFLVTTIVLITLTAMTRQFAFKVKAQGNLQLQLPFNGTYRINSYVDHQTPFQKNEISIMMFNGEEYNDCPGISDQWTNQGPYCYDGHEGVDWAMGENTPVLAAA